MNGARRVGASHRFSDPRKLHPLLPGPVEIALRMYAAARASVDVVEYHDIRPEILSEQVKAAESLAALIAIHSADIVMDADVRSFVRQQAGNASPHASRAWALLAAEGLLAEYGPRLGCMPGGR